MDKSSPSTAPISDLKVCPGTDPILPKVWVTKYALTRGVATVVNARHCVSTNNKTISFCQMSFPHEVILRKPDWHTTEADAIAQTRKMVESELRSLTTEQIRLEALKVKLTKSLDVGTWNQK